MTYRPWMGRQFGFECELNTETVDRTSLSESMLKNAIRPVVPRGRLNEAAAHYYHSDGTKWDVKTDASCGWEVASPAMTLNAGGHNDEMRAALQAISALRPRIRANCGLHVHVELRDYSWQDLQKLIRLWARYEPFFFELVPAGRRTNNYCQPIRRSTWAGSDHHYFSTTRNAMNATTEQAFDRYARSFPRGAINLGGWWRSKRIEFRLHSGTANYEKVRHWVMLLLTVVARVKHQTMSPVENVSHWNSTEGVPVSYVGKVLGLVRSAQVPDVPPESRELLGWMEARRLQFAPAIQQAVRQMAAAEEAEGGTPRPAAAQAAPGGDVMPQDVVSAIDAALGRF